ncbi:MAG: BatA domain-containing protein [Rudanella sp.]|nr:BatA domain-containing protein [Rudanella sp.]
MMTFLQPAFLWGLLAIAIPVLIHLWHQKRGQPLPWAAMQWLREASEQQQRGLKFDDWLLLAVRCLVIALLSILLAQPIWKPDTDPKAIRVVHVVASDSLVRSTFRFELERARQVGEPVVALPADNSLNPLLLQAVLDSLRQPDLAVHLYVRNDASLADVPQISVPERFSLHTALSPRQVSQRLSGVGQNPFSGIKRPLAVWLNYRNSIERQTVTAALRALAGVYALNLNISTNPNSTRQHDWVLTDQFPGNPRPQTLYTVSGASGGNAQNRVAQGLPNVVFVADTLTPQTSERVENGQLPEWLGYQLLDFYKRNPTSPALTQQEMDGLFVRTNAMNTAQTVSISRIREQNWLLLALLVVIGIERWLALRK